MVDKPDMIIHANHGSLEFAAKGKTLLRISTLIDVASSVFATIQAAPKEQRRALIQSAFIYYSGGNNV